MGWSDGAVLGKLPVPGRPTNLDDSRVRAYCACSRCGGGLVGHFYSPQSFHFSFSLFLGDGLIKTEILSQRTVKLKITNDQNLACKVVEKSVTKNFIFQSIKGKKIG